MPSRWKWHSQDWGYDERRPEIGKILATKNTKGTRENPHQWVSLQIAFVFFVFFVFFVAQFLFLSLW